MERMCDKAAQNVPASAPVPIFGAPQANQPCTERRAAYAVVFDPDVCDGAGRVAAVRGPSGRLWLPGGGSLADESPAQTVIREVREELARNVRLIRQIGAAIEFFYAAGEDRHFRMSATFFQAEFGDTLQTEAEYEIYWVPINEVRTTFFHKCHAWAVRQATASDL
jgi:8-oxo-dGTP pyrophosphatase MutT (NUDIX family)